METMEGVNHDKRQRGYGARDKEEIIKTIIKLHKEGYSQVGIAKRLNISRSTIKRWNDDLHFIEARTPGNAGKLKNKICSDLYLSSLEEIRLMAKELYKYGDIKLNRKYEKFSSLMI